MPVIKKTVSIVHQRGLHARPAALFVQLAKKYECSIVVRKGRKIVDGKSIMGLLTLGANKGARIAITANGEDAPKAIDDLIALVTKPLPEPAKQNRQRS